MTSSYLDLPIRDRFEILRDTVRRMHVEWPTFARTSNDLGIIAALIDTDADMSHSFFRVGGSVKEFLGWRGADLEGRDMTCLLRSGSAAARIGNLILQARSKGFAEARLVIRNAHDVEIGAKVMLIASAFHHEVPSGILILMAECPKETCEFP